MTTHTNPVALTIDKIAIVSPAVARLRPKLSSAISGSVMLSVFVIAVW